MIKKLYQGSLSLTNAQYTLIDFQTAHTLTSRPSMYRQSPIFSLLDFKSTFSTRGDNSLIYMDLLVEYTSPLVYANIIAFLPLLESLPLLQRMAHCSIIPQLSVLAWVLYKKNQLYTTCMYAPSWTTGGQIAFLPQKKKG